jgi:hypothetical protein
LVTSVEVSGDRVVAALHAVNKLSQLVDARI